MSERAAESAWPRLWCFGLLLPLAFSLLFLSGRWLLAVAYVTYAEEQLDTGWQDAATKRAAELSVQLLPYGAREKALHARLLADSAQLDRAHAEFREALLAAPADPMNWQGFVRYKIRANQYDAEMEHAMQRVRELAPGVTALHFDNALLAIRYWAWGTRRMRDSWKESLHFVMRRDPQGFLGAVLINREEDMLCREPALRMPQTEKWCEAALYARGACFNPYRQPDVTQWCIQFGYPAEFLQ